MKYIVRFLIVVLFFPTITLLVLFLLSALLSNAIYYPIYFVRNGEPPYRKLDDMAWDTIEDCGYKFTHWLIKKGWIKDN